MLELLVAAAIAAQEPEVQPKAECLAIASIVADFTSPELQLEFAWIPVAAERMIAQTRPELIPAIVERAKHEKEVYDHMLEEALRTGNEDAANEKIMRGRDTCWLLGAELQDL